VEEFVLVVILPLRLRLLRLPQCLVGLSARRVATKEDADDDAVADADEDNADKDNAEEEQEEDEQDEDGGEEELLLMVVVVVLGSRERSGLGESGREAGDDEEASAQLG